MAAKPFALGYIGVGLMGGPMSERLVRLGWRVTAYDIAEPRLAATRAAGAAIASSAAEGGGTLTVMAGGEEADLERLAPLMRDIAARCTRMGPVGAGLGAKMINQLIVGVGHAMIAEAVALCASAGIDAARIPECLAGGYADSNVMKAYWPRMVERDFAPRGYLRQLLKDLEMVNAWAGSVKAPVPQLAQALSLLRLAASHGYSELDSSAVINIYRK